MVQYFTTPNAVLFLVVTTVLLDTYSALLIATAVFKIAKYIALIQRIIQVNAHRSLSQLGQGPVREHHVETNTNGFLARGVR